MTKLEIIIHVFIMTLLFIMSFTIIAIKFNVPITIAYILISNSYLLYWIITKYNNKNYCDK